MLSDCKVIRRSDSWTYNQDRGHNKNKGNDRQTLPKRLWIAPLREHDWISHIKKTNDLLLAEVSSKWPDSIAAGLTVKNNTTKSVGKEKF